MNEQLDLNDAPTISLREYGDILRRRRAIILQAFLFVVIVGIIWTSFQTNIYSSTARLLIEPQSAGINLNTQNNPLDQLFRISQNYNVNTQVELLQTPDMLKRVSDKINGRELPMFTVQALEGTSIIQVDAESPDQNLAAEATNTLLEAYRDHMRELRSGSTKKALDYAIDEQKKAQTLLEQTDKKIALFKKKNDIVELELNRKSAADSFDAANAELSRIDTEQAALNSRIAATRAQLAATSPTLTNTPAPEADALVQSLQQRIADLETRRTVLLDSLQPGTETITALNLEIVQLKERLIKAEASYQQRTSANNPVYLQLREAINNYNTEAVVLAKRLAESAESVAKKKQRIASLPNLEQINNTLANTRAGALSKISSYGANIGDLQTSMSAQSDMATIIDRATASDKPVRPNRVQNILFAAVIGLFLGLGLALLQELFDDRINSADEAERVLKLPSLGYIPNIEEEGLRLIRDISTFSPLMESYRTLRTNINFAAVGKQVRSMVVTSSVPAEGKSTTCANLAMAMAMDGKKVIIVDADLRRPSQHHLFKVDASPGLTDILIGSHSIDEVMRQTSVENVFIIPAGSPPPNPAELLGSAAMGRFLAEVETRADVVLLDTPPALAVADATVLAARTDGALLVVGYGDTKKTSVKRAKEMLARGNANILGTVLNRMEGAGGGYYYYGKYYMGSGYAPYAPGSGVGGKKSGYAPVTSGKKRSSVGGYAPARDDRKRIEGNGKSGANAAIVEPTENNDEA
ncbi:MAG: polysaccharide biosynthesis tyrosine autokinase [Armatimonadetes bacterium]|nr:polysaccharide biosynthesis tyrosine autokinase [Armatimonadota bacterium]